MSTLPNKCVADASVVIKLFLLEEFTSQVQSFFLTLDNKQAIYAPDLLPIECSNILWRHVRFQGYPFEQAVRDQVDLLKLAIQWIPTMPLLPRALEIASPNSVTIYDACYVTLAEKMKMPLLTADNRLAGQLVNTPHVIITLDNLFSVAS